MKYIYLLVKIINIKSISTLPDLQALTDVMIMLCICPTKLISLYITDNWITGYAKNQEQEDIPRNFKSMEKDPERAKELLIWIQNTISSGQIGDPGKAGVKWLNVFLKNYNLIL
ncbi:hypothetical protein Glove_16g136 [Diversispora epigaea]|uniref:Uncharacterized protein n=1 Tax=Diversispora epigaea TaxID=1348612 RepID=A0A397JTA2_9GLOM|nr:hypothetical protein Glove_16g136 [Diversispora epigaea]